MTNATDVHAAGVIEARLGRPARDVVEATVVLEAWAGVPAAAAMSTARGVIRSEGTPPRGMGRVDTGDRTEQQTVVFEGIALIMSILSVAAWATPLSRAFGTQALADAIRVALPVAVAIQWGLRSRYLSLPTGLALLARDGVPLIMAAVAVEVSLALVPGWGWIAALLIAIWVGGAIITRRGWGLLYAIALVVAAVALSRHAPARLVLLVLTSLVVAACAAGLLTRRADTDERPGTVARALLAALLGGCVGVLLVADPSLGWGVRGIHPAIALLPSVVGSLWGGYHLWNLYQAVPRALSGVPPVRASRLAITGPAMSLLLGAMLRVVAATVVLSAVVIAAAPWTQGTDENSVFVAFGLVALFSLHVSLLESLGRARAALVAAAAALAAEFVWPHVVTWHVAGAPLAVGAAVGLLLTLPPLVALLSRAGRVLATTLWIH
ncbi:MAG: hypothetical protein ACJ780_25410 [Solirubrobacteraceae bacterium]